MKGKNKIKIEHIALAGVGVVGGLFFINAVTGGDIEKKVQEVTSNIPSINIETLLPQMKFPDITTPVTSIFNEVSEGIAGTTGSISKVVNDIKESGEGIVSGVKEMAEIPKTLAEGTTDLLLVPFTVYGKVAEGVEQHGRITGEVIRKTYEGVEEHGRQTGTAIKEVIPTIPTLLFSPITFFRRLFGGY